MLNPASDGRRAAVCASVTELTEHTYKDRATSERKRFAKLTLQQNNDVVEMVCWSETCETHREKISALKDRIVIVSGMVRYSDYSGTNNLQSTKSTIIHIV